ncbi:uncharacterized protein BO66DRAFT_406577 [Aspergillus aculeatinus CBS 121060]|uniref:Uncharacterized protein n=1 Tax=Aspergillus aculeatinus CBS 121060 TaxID=1448322 RepID=A0ACD1GSD1_9EURO|nr:hypothetical protein BO66DRAFT_406577 [Aspergillus aculeatinus CBS 121060]RAH64231.1 hypothetical protein BO66DRAFT_406577 [Aspergillus aculeatinus CBS 121060]
MPPQTPYQLGFEFVVREHHPPSQIPADFEFNESKDPLPGRFGEKELRLRVCKGLRVGSGYSAQVAVVQEVLSGRPPKHPGSLHRDPDELGPKMVAKLYDARYLGSASRTRVQAVRFMDEQYVRESAAYRHLLHHQLHRYIPEYYGSWSTRTPDPASKTMCEVRLILTELVEGTDMRQLRPESFSLGDRQAIMRRIVKIESAFYACDLQHRDVYPRNVIITRPDPRAEKKAGKAGGGPPRVTVIDFGLARIGRSWLDVKSPHCAKTDLLPGTYISPILRWWQVDNAQDTWFDWVTWDWNRWLAETFRADIPHITPDMLKWVGPQEREDPFFQQFEKGGSCDVC